MAPLMKQTAFRMTDEDIAILDEAKRQSGALSRAEALRVVLRFWAESHGVKPKPRSKPKRK